MTGLATAAFGVYVHIPYCRQHCPYCDFNIHVTRHRTPPWAELVAAITTELAARAELFAGQPATSVYFGGGTPSLMPPDVLAALLAGIAAHCGIATGAEITVEVDPGTPAPGALAAYRRAGVNRLSLGWQSTDDHLLARLGRGHDARAAVAAFRRARQAAFANVSVDLIFAVPGQSLAALDRDLDVLETQQPEHVSTYALTVNRGSTFFKLRARGELELPPEEVEIEMTERLGARLAAAGYERYEVSNYARPGARSRHNWLYWTGAPYLGVGPGAHSFLPASTGGWRWETTRRPWRYIERYRRGVAPGLPSGADGTTHFVESLTRRQALTERLLCGLRLPAGIDLARLDLGEARPAIERAAHAAAARGWLRIAGNHLTPTAMGLRFCDALAELFF